MVTMSLWMVFFFLVVLLYLGISIGIAIARHILTHPESRLRGLLLTDNCE